jgi:hypothetical protein
MQTCRRRQPRYTLGPERPAHVELHYPGPADPTVRFEVADLSASGIGLRIDAPIPGLEFGKVLKDAVLHCGERTLRFDLLLVHVTEDFASGITCGCLLYPAADADVRTLHAILADLARGGTPEPEPALDGQGSVRSLP